MKDLIERQAAIDAVHKEFDDCIVWDESGMTTANEVERILDSVPPAQPERKKGVWIRHPEWERDGECGYECSVCGMGSDVDYPFCMRCGADMRGDKDGR